MSHRTNLSGDKTRQSVHRCSTHWSSAAQVGISEEGSVKATESGPWKTISISTAPSSTCINSHGRQQGPWREEAPMGGRGRKELHSARVHSVTHAVAMGILISREYGKSTSYKKLPQLVEIYTWKWFRYIRALGEHCTLFYGWDVWSPEFMAVCSQRWFSCRWLGLHEALWTGFVSWKLLLLLRVWGHKSQGVL